MLIQQNARNDYLLNHNSIRQYIVSYQAQHLNNLAKTKHSTHKNKINTHRLLQSIPTHFLQ